MVGVLTASQAVPIYVPLLFVAWGVLMWFAGLRRLVRDPRAEARRIAEVRARSRLLRPFPGFAPKWIGHWLGPVAIMVGYVIGVLLLFVGALWG